MQWSMKTKTLEQEINEKLEISINPKKQKRWRSTYILFGLLFVNGVSIAYMIDNIYLMPVFGYGFSCIPLLFRKRQKKDEFKLALSAITNLYSTTQNIVESMNHCLPVLPARYKSSFLHFGELPIQEGIDYLKGQIPISYFQRWCDMLQLTQRDFTMYPLMFSVLQKQSDYEITAYNYLEKKHRIKIGAVTLFFVFLFLFGVLLLVNRECRFFFFSESGKQVTALYLLAVAICFYTMRTKERGWDFC